MGALTMAASVSGCLAVWGSTYKVRYESETAIGIDFDPAVTTLGNVQAVAQEHCSRYGKDAILRTKDTNSWGVRSIQFSCRARTG
ncbi:hypothetical protein [Dongia sedimenti]|uniref:Lipoprotein n=1 Tax=Dongia sedimenti TaxID=3064282 RepID=A0ABU0YKD5_9PROT|nr:hypothetical protein [Rhodospirillaceae bacterium R-7]